MIAREVGVDPSKINYVPFRGGGEATAAILGGNVTVGGSGYSEFQQYIESGKMRAIAVTSGARLKGIERAHAEGAGHQRRDRQLARRLRRARHHAPSSARR
jgi:putative tricarboxylic transport membrane protein